MKARNFRYIRPASLAHAYQILADAGGDAVPVAGGQSLLAGLNMRLSAPKLLVDIGNLEELTGQSQVGGAVRLGALTRHAELLNSDLVRRHLPLLARLEAASPMPIPRLSCRPARWRLAQHWCWAAARANAR
jgi:carbon-monoxide dehydrogenase medium subunit